MAASGGSSFRTLSGARCGARLYKPTPESGRDRVPRSTRLGKPTGTPGARQPTAAGGESTRAGSLSGSGRPGAPEDRSRRAPALPTEGQQVADQGDRAEQEGACCVAGGDPCAAKALRPWRAGDDQKQVHEDGGDQRSDQADDEDERQEQQEDLQADKGENPPDEGVLLQAGDVCLPVEQLHPVDQIEGRIGQHERQDEEDQAVQKEAERGGQTGEEKRSPPAGIDPGSSKEPARGTWPGGPGRRSGRTSGVGPCAPPTD